LGAAFVAWLAMATAPLLHLRFEYVADSPLKFVPNAPFVFAERRPVVVVEILDDLKGPPAVNHIAADDLGLEPLGDRIVAGGAQSVARLAQQQIGMSHQLMKRVQLTPCPLDTLQGLRNGADGPTVASSIASGRTRLSASVWVIVVGYPLCDEDASFLH
jgi:hypothetical protein